MAQNTFINVTGDKAMTTKSDGYHSHTVSGSTSSASGDFSVSYDSAVVTSIAIYDTLARAARNRAIAAGLK